MDEAKIAEQASELMGHAACSAAQAKQYATPDQDSLDAVAFVGETLAPFFLNDPSRGALDEALAAFGALDVAAASKEWPFVGGGMAGVALDLMKEGVQAREEDAGEAMKWEYRRLFVGPQALPVPPWGSVYTDRDCVCFGASTLELRAWMRQHGIARTTDEATPEDHIGLLLAMAAWIAREKPELLCEFLELHVLPWSGHLLGQMVEAAQYPFYRGLAMLADSSLRGMAGAFSLTPETPRFYR